MTQTNSIQLRAAMPANVLLLKLIDMRYNYYVYYVSANYFILIIIQMVDIYNNEITSLLLLQVTYFLLS